MMFGKALVFGDYDIIAEIMEAKDPKDQKALGRKVKGFDKDLWEVEAYGIVMLGNFLKFTQNPNLQDVFTLYEDTELFVEASPVDTIWGIGRSMTDPARFEYLEWRGQNLLGQAITEVRDFLDGNPEEGFFANLQLAYDALGGDIP